MEMIHQIQPYLRRLRLSGMLDTLEVRLQQAVAEKISYLDFLAMLF